MDLRHSLARVRAMSCRSSARRARHCRGGFRAKAQQAGSSRLMDRRRPSASHPAPATRGPSQPIQISVALERGTRVASRGAMMCSAAEMPRKRRRRSVLGTPHVWMKRFSATSSSPPWHPALGLRFKNRRVPILTSPYEVANRRCSGNESCDGGVTVEQAG